MNAYDIIIQPWLTEKSMEARTTEQRLEFLVRRSATKAQIARAVETIFDVEVAKVKAGEDGRCLSGSRAVVEGLDVVLSGLAVKDLCAEDLAPGGDIGRLTVFTKAALEAMN